MTLLGSKGTVPTWAECRKEMSDPDGILDKIKDFDRDKQMTRDKCKALNDKIYFNPDGFDPEKFAKVDPLAGKLADFVIANHKAHDLEK